MHCFSSSHKHEQTFAFPPMAKLFVWICLLFIFVSIVSSEFPLEGEEQLTKQIVKGKYGSGSIKSNQCPNACSRRCSKTQYHKPCMFFCQKCCRKCLCVPPGFYGNKQVCPCYNNWKTKRGGPKCP